MTEGPLPMSEIMNPRYRLTFLIILPSYLLAELHGVSLDRAERADVRKQLDAAFRAGMLLWSEYGSP